MGGEKKKKNPKHYTYYKAFGKTDAHNQLILTPDQI